MNINVRGRSYAPGGQTPVAKVVGGTCQKLSMISTVTNQGKTRWHIIENNFNHEKLTEFFQTLIEDAGHKIFIILDNLCVHHYKPIKVWLEEHRDEIEAFYLSSYNPELNPDERLNADPKQAMSTKVPARTNTKSWSAAKQHLARLEDDPHRVKTYSRIRGFNTPPDTVYGSEQ